LKKIFEVVLVQSFFSLVMTFWYFRLDIVKWLANLHHSLIIASIDIDYRLERAGQVAHLLLFLSYLLTVKVQPLKYFAVCSSGFFLLHLPHLFLKLIGAIDLLKFPITQQTLFDGLLVDTVSPGYPLALFVDFRVKQAGVLASHSLRTIFDIP